MPNSSEFGSAVDQPDTTLTLTTTSGTSGLKTATLRIASNDGDENPFEIPLRLLSLNPAADTDRDSIATLTPPHFFRALAR